MKMQSRRNVTGRAKTVEEKFEIMDRLLAVWLKYPDMRLLQLIEAKIFYNRSLEDDGFYIEDEEFIKIMERENE